MALRFRGQRQRRGQRHGSYRKRDSQAVEDQKGEMLNGAVMNGVASTLEPNSEPNSQDDEDDSNEGGGTGLHEGQERGATRKSLARLPWYVLRRLRRPSRLWKPESLRSTNSTVDDEDDDGRSFATCSSGGSGNDICFVPFLEDQDGESSRQSRRRSSLSAMQRRVSQILQHRHKVHEFSVRFRYPLLASLFVVVGIWGAGNWGLVEVTFSTTILAVLRLWVVWSAIQVCLFLVWWLNVLRPGKGVLDQAGASFGRQVHYLSQPRHRPAKLASVVAGTRYTFDI